MKFSKIALSIIFAFTLPLSGCSSSVEETAHVIDADRAKGTVDIGFILMQLGLYLTMEERTQIGYMLKMKLKRFVKNGDSKTQKN